MKNVLEEFANDNLRPNSRFFKKNSEYGRTVKKVSDAEEKLGALLHENEKELFNEFSNAQGEINLLSGTDKFIYGYRLGVLMTMEVFNTSDDLVVGGEADEK